MPTSEARILANQANATKSRAIARNHGLTDEGAVYPEEDAEVERLSRAFGDELQAEGEVGHALARRMAVMSVRMDRCVDQEAAALSQRVRRALDEFEPPEGVDSEEAERLRSEAGARAMFDTSKEACLARKYEAAAERCFFRALKELRELNKKKAGSPAADPAAEARASMARLGSFLHENAPAPMARLGSFLPEYTPAPSKPSTAAPVPTPTPSKPRPVISKSSPDAWDPFPTTHFDVPITIGRAR